MRVDLPPVKERTDFIHKVNEISGQNLLLYYQCGKCSSGCPMAPYQDYFLPNQITRLVQLGMEEELAHTKAIWMCTSCRNCKVHCPRGVDLYAIIVALRVLARRERDRKEGSIYPEATNIRI